MDAERFARVEAIFQEALPLSGLERDDCLARRCGDDSDLKQQVLSLLAAHDQAGDLLDRPVVPRRPDQGRLAETRIGPYKLLRKIGEGGMSEVYLAVRADDEYQKRVALKIIRQDLDRDEMLRRFRIERQILAGLNHPNIATLFDGGTTEDGLPFFVMEYIDGTPIDLYCDENGLTLPRRVELFRSVCSAVQFAHQNLVIHRDIKASNILVTADGTPKLLDFGIAKLINPDHLAGDMEFTITGVRPMTPRYASPEQIEGRQVGTPSDIYSLGVLLYILLTGVRPHRLKGRPATELSRIILEEDAERPSTAVARAGSSVPNIEPGQLQRQLTGDLDNIILKALRKQPQRRYPSVEHFAEDLRRHQAGLPVMARKDTFGYRAHKFIRRNLLGVSAAAVIMALVVAFGVVMAIQANRIRHERDQAQLERDRAEQVVGFMEEIFGVTDPYEADGEELTASEILERGAARVTGELNDQPIVQATLLQKIGNVYLHLGRYDQAEPAMKQALEIRRRELSPGHHDIGRSLQSLGLLHAQKGDLEKGEQLIREAVRILVAAETTPGEYSVKPRLELGVVLRKSGQYEEAEQVYTAVLELQHNFKDDDVLASAKNNMAALLASTGRLEEAELMLQETLALRRKVHSDLHPQTAQALSNLGAVLGMQGKYDEAEPHLRESLASFREVLPAGHPSLVEALNNLGKLLRRMGKTVEAEPLVREALEIQQSTAGPGHPQVGILYATLAELLQAQKRYDEAEDSIRKAVAISKAAYSGPHVSTGNALIRQGMLTMDQGMPEDAEPLYREAREIYQATLAEGHWKHGGAESRLGESLAAQGKLEEGLALMRSGLATLEAGLGPDHPGTREARERLDRIRHP